MKTTAEIMALADVYARLRVEAWREDGSGGQAAVETARQRLEQAISGLAEPSDGRQATPETLNAKATFKYQIESSTGYKAEGVYHNISAHRYGKVIAALEGSFDS